MPATRSRTSTEQAAEVASEDVKQPQEEKEIVDKASEQVEADEAAKEPAEKEPAAVESEESAAGEEAEEKKEEEPQGKEENGKAEPTESVENGEEKEAVAAVDAVETPTKRKSEVGGEGDGPDSTEVTSKKAKVDLEETAEEETPAPVEASA